MMFHSEVINHTNDGCRRLIWLSGFTQVTLLLFVSIDHPSDRLGGRFNSIIDVIRVDAIRTLSDIIS